MSDGAQIDYLALARVGIANPDRRPDGSGLDDGVPLPKWHRKGEAIAMRQSGKTLRTIAAEIGVSHEAVRDWTRGITTQEPRHDR